VCVLSLVSQDPSPSPTSAEPSTTQGTAHRRHMRRCHMYRHTEHFHMAKHTRTSTNLDVRIENNSCIPRGCPKEVACVCFQAERCSPLQLSNPRSAYQVKQKRVTKESKLAFTSSHHSLRLCPLCLSLPPLRLHPFTGRCY